MRAPSTLGKRVDGPSRLLDEVGILRGVEQFADLAGIGDLETDHPAGVRVGVDRFRACP